MARVSVLLCLVLLVTLGVVVSFSFALNTETTLQHQESSKTATTLDHKSTHNVQAGQQVTGDQHGHKKKDEDTDSETDTDDDHTDDDTADDTDDDTDDDKKKKKTVKTL